MRYSKIILLSLIYISAWIDIGTATDTSCSTLILNSGVAPLNCAMIKQANPSAISGVYTIKVVNNCSLTTNCCVNVYCDMVTFGGGWLEFQKRYDGTVDFFRNWTEYANGFGTPPGEYWLGNNYIWAITNQQSYELLIELKPYEGSCALYVRYTSFLISSAATLYVLNLGSVVPGGTETDSLSFQQGRPWTTYDQDHDGDGSNCASLYHGAWWYAACHQSNLNGYYLYHGACTPIYATHLSWFFNYAGKDYYYSYEQTAMKLRPVSSGLNTAFRGTYCLSAANITGTCVMGDDCIWSSWGSWSTCSQSCDPGTQTRIMPQYSRTGVFTCTISINQTQNCTAVMCPINCQWSAWNNWTSCSTTCAAGRQFRSRTITVSAQYNGTACVASDANDTQTCDLGPCPVDCIWTNWTSWSTCSKTCDMGRIQRTRTNASIALYGGVECLSSLRSETKECNLKTCTKGLTAAAIASRSLQTMGCSWLIGLTGTTIVLFIALRQVTLERVLHMCQELSLLVAHVIIILSVNYDIRPYEEICIASSIALQYLFCVHYLFIALEALQTYCVLTNVISFGGCLKSWVNLLIGWGMQFQTSPNSNERLLIERTQCTMFGCNMFNICSGVPAVIAVPMAALMYSHYPSEYACWLNMGHKVSMGTILPASCCSALTFIFIEAAGMGDHERMPLQLATKRTTAMLSRGSLFIILPLSLAAWFTGQLALYNGHVGLYTVVFVINVALGVSILKFHTLQNEKVRTCLSKVFSCCKKQ